MNSVRAFVSTTLIWSGIFLGFASVAAGDEPGKPTRLGRVRETDKEPGMDRNSIAFSVDGKKLAWVFHQPRPKREDGGLEIVVWDLDKGKIHTNMTAATEQTFAASPLRFTPKGDMIFMGCIQVITTYTQLGRPGAGLHNSVRFWELRREKEWEIIPYEKTYSHDRFESVTISGDGKTVSALRSKGGAVWSIPDGKEARKFEKGPEAYWLTMSADGKVGAGTLARDPAKLTDKATVWKTEDGKEIFITPGITLELSSDGKLLATKTDANIVVWDVAAGKKRFELASDIPGGEMKRVSAAFSAKSKYFAWNAAGKIHVADVTTGKLLWTLNGEQGPLAFSPDETTLALACPDGTALLWNVKKAEKK
jgi:WD40 repeat protein